MGKNRGSDKKHRAMQQHIQAGYDIVTKLGSVKQPSKAELRASMPLYDESMVKRIEAKPRRKSSKL
jgi:hypothetical protein